jgi:hypothetical protein
LPDLEIFAQGLVERRDGGWRITKAGRSALALMEKPTGPQAQIAAPEPSPAIPHPASLVVARDRPAAARSDDGVAGGRTDNGRRRTTPRSGVFEGSWKKSRTAAGSRSTTPDGFPMEKLLEFIPGPKLPLPLRYGLTVLIVTVCALLQIGLQAHSRFPGFFLMLPGIFLCGLLFDRGSGFLAALLSVLFSIFGISAELFSSEDILPYTLFGSYRQILVTARPVRRRRLWADGQSGWR